MLMNLSHKKVLITGGSAGIGKALIHELILQGVKEFAVVGRRQDKLEKLKVDRKSTRLNSSHSVKSRMPSSA